MRVLYVEAAYGFGGSLTGLLHLFSGLPADVEPLLITGFDPHPYTDLPPGLIHRQADIPQRPEREGNWLRGLADYYRYNVRPWSRAVDRAITELQPDLIHTNNSATINLGAGLAGHKRGVPTIAHHKKFEYPERLSRWALQRKCYTHHIATSDAIATHLHTLGLAPDRCTRVYEPVIGPSDEQLVRGAANQSDDHIPVVAMHSMLVHWKGQHVFLPAVAEVRRRCKTPFRVVIAGGPPANDIEYAEGLQAQAHELGLGDLVEFPGHVRDVYDFLSTVDIAVHAAIDPEPFGRVVPEAMLSGLPCVVTLDGGPAEYIVDGKTGLHVPRGDIQAMADAIEKLILSQTLRQHMGRAAREFALQEFDPTLLGEETVAVYQQVLSASIA